MNQNNFIVKAISFFLFLILKITQAYCQTAPVDCQCYNFRNSGTFSMASGVEFRIDAPNIEAGRFFIANNGNVGIGVVDKNPLAKLHVNGNTYINGNLGIGTSNPQAALEVNGKSIFDDDVSFKKVSIPGILNIPKTGFLQFGSDVPEREANAGQIAYQKYTDALDISGAGNDINSRKIYFHAEGGSFLSCGGTGMLFEIGHNTGGSSAWIGTTTTHGLFIGTNSVGSIYLDSKQHVFVSSSSIMPVVSSKNLEKYDLFVTRGILSEDYALAPVSAWADYVFKSEYHLSPLNDVEKFIKTNNHLPGIPSQQQISTGGYSLKDMNVKFLVKIEELTLYVIQQQKTINELKTELQGYKKLSFEIEDLKEEMLENKKSNNKK